MGERARLPANRNLPLELVSHRNRSEIYRFEKTRYYDPGTTVGMAGIAAAVLGNGSVAVAIRLERRR